MDIKNIRKELSTIDIDEDVQEDIIEKIVNMRKDKVVDNQVSKEIKIAEWQEQKKIEVDWKKRAIIAAKIIKINLD